MQCPLWIVHTLHSVYIGHNVVLDKTVQHCTLVAAIVADSSSWLA